MATKTKTATEPKAPEVTTPAAPSLNGHKSTADLVKERETLFVNLKENLTSLQTKRAWHMEQIEAIDAEVGELRDLLPNLPEDELPAPRTATTVRAPRQDRRGRGGNEDTLRDLAFSAVKKAGKTGISRLEVAKMLLAGGYETRAVKNSKKPTDEELEKFAASVYVSGIYPLIKDGLVESFRAGREAFYRLVK